MGERCIDIAKAVGSIPTVTTKTEGERGFRVLIETRYMNMRVLLLDRDCEPIKIIGWKRAVYLLFTGKAEVLIEGTESVRSPSSSFNVPSVIRQFAKYKRKKTVPFTRINIFQRDNWVCQYCSKTCSTKQLTFDHVVPTCQGGIASWTNIVSACKPCNGAKGGRTPLEAGMKLIRQPKRPDVDDMPDMIIKVKHKVPKEWKIFFDKDSFAYWNVELLEA